MAPVVALAAHQFAPRELPHNLEAERSILGAILIENSAYPKAAAIVDSRMFFRDAHRRIYERMIDLADQGKAIDLVLLVAELERVGDLEEVGGPAYVASLVDGVPRSTNVEGYAQIVKDKAALREVISAGNQVISEAYGPDANLDEIITGWVDRLGSATAGASARKQQILTRDEVLKERARVEARRIVASENTSTAIVKPHPVPLAELLARDLPPLEYAIDRLQPKGAKVLLAAQAKAGKTNLVINAIRSRVDGELFLGTFQPAPLEGRVCLIDLEMTDRQLHYWYSQAGIRNLSRVVVQQLRGKVASFNILDRGVRSEWAAKLRELEVSDLFFDNLRPLMDALGLDENSDAGRLLVAFDALVAEAEIGQSMIVHHMGHNANRSRGDSRLRDWPDVEWFLTREKNDKGEVENLASPRYFAAYGRDVDFQISQLAFDEGARRLSLIGGSPAQNRSDAALAAVYELLAEGPAPKSTIEAKVTGYSRPAIREAIDRGLTEHVLRLEVGPKGAHLISRGSASPPARHSSPPVRQVSPISSSQLAAPYRGGRASELGEAVSSSPIQGGDHDTYSL